MGAAPGSGPSLGAFRMDLGKSTGSHQPGSGWSTWTNPNWSNTPSYSLADESWPIIQVNLDFRGKVTALLLIRSLQGLWLSFPSRS